MAIRLGIGTRTTVFPVIEAFGRVFDGDTGHAR